MFSIHLLIINITSSHYQVSPRLIIFQQQILCKIFFDKKEAGCQSIEHITQFFRNSSTFHILPTIFLSMKTIRPIFTANSKYVRSPCSIRFHSPYQIYLALYNAQAEQHNVEMRMAYIKLLYTNRFQKHVFNDAIETSM